MVTTHFFFFFPELGGIPGEPEPEVVTGMGVAMSYDQFRRLERQQLRRLQMIRKDDEEILALILALMRRKQ